MFSIFFHSKGIFPDTHRHRIDVALVAGERLLALPVPDVPQLGGRIAGARHERPAVRRQRQRHHVAGVAHERGGLLAGFNVPQTARHVAGAGHNLTIRKIAFNKYCFVFLSFFFVNEFHLIIVEEPTARQIAGVAGQLPGHAHITLARLQAVDRADIVESAARHIAAGRRIGARHHPRGAQRNRMDLVRRVRIPDDQLAVLRGGHQIPGVAAPVHGVDLGEMAAQGATRAHLDAADRLEGVCGLNETGVAGDFAGVANRVL